MIENLDEACSYYDKEVLGNKARITRTFHGQRGPLAKRLNVAGNAYNHVVFFKKSWNNYFGRKFRKRQEIGQTTNLKILEEAAFYGDMIGVVHPNGECYACLAQDWLSYARKEGTIWMPATESQYEASIPAEMLQPMSRASMIVRGKTKLADSIAEDKKKWGILDGYL